MGRAQRKGYELERLVELGLIEEGFDASRPRAGSPEDKGDIYGVPDWTIQCKNQNGLSLGAWIDATLRQQANGKTKYHALIYKRKGKAKFEDQFVIMTAGQWLELIGRVQK